MFKWIYKIIEIKNGFNGQTNIVDKFKRRELAFIDTDFWWRYSSTSRKIIKKRIDQLLNILFYYLNFELFDYFLFIFLFFTLLHNYNYFGFFFSDLFNYIILYVFFLIAFIIYLVLLFVICFFVFFIFLIFFIYIFIKNKGLFYLLKHIIKKLLLFTIFYLTYFYWNSFLLFFVKKFNRILFFFNNFKVLLFLYYIKYYKKYLNLKKENLSTFKDYLNYIYTKLTKLPIDNKMIIFYRKKNYGLINIEVFEEEIRFFVWKDSDMVYLNKRLRIERLKKIIRTIFFFNRTSFYKSLKSNFFRSIEYIVIAFNLFNFLNKEKHKIYTAFFTIWAWEPDYINDWDFKNWRQTYTFRTIRYKITFYDLRGFFFYILIDLLHYISPVIRFIHYIYWEAFFIQIRSMAAPFRSEFERDVIYYTTFLFHILWKNPEVERRYLKRQLKKFWYFFVYLDVFEFFFNFKNLVKFYWYSNFIKKFFIFFDKYIKIYYLNLIKIIFSNKFLKKLLLKYSYIFLYFNYMMILFINIKNIIICFLKICFSILYYILFKWVFFFFSKKKFKNILKKFLIKYDNFVYFDKLNFDIVSYRKRRDLIRLKVNFSVWLDLFYNYERNRFIDPTQVNFRYKKMREFNEYKRLLLEAIHMYQQVFKRIERYKKLPLYKRLFREFNFVPEIDTSFVFAYDNKFRKSYIVEKVRILKKEYKYSKRYLIKHRYTNLNFLYYYNKPLKKKNHIKIKKKFKKRIKKKKKNKKI